MRDYLLLDEFASDWSEDRREAMEATRAEILRMFWEGRFERLGRRNGPGTILAVREENRPNFPDQEFDGMPFGREEFLAQILLGGPCTLPAWGAWSSDAADPQGWEFRIWFLGLPSNERAAALQQGFGNLRSCPFERYDPTAQVYLKSLGFPIEMLSRFFTDRARNRPPFLVRAQAHLSGAFQNERAGRGRRSYAFDEAELHTWFEREVERLNAAGAKMSADAVYDQAQRTFDENVPRTLIRKLHKDLAPASWRQRGRKPPRT